MTAPFPAPAPSRAPDSPRVESSPRRGRLAIALQEAFTTVARLRSNKQVATDAESFRVRIKQVLASAEADARAAGYTNDDVRFALFAVIAFLDETVLNSGQPMFAHWQSRTLQEEVFGVHMAGELFFQYLQELMSRQDSADLVDVLEVYSLCLLLGFKGRYSHTHGTDVQVHIRQLADKIERVRGKLGDLSPQWRPSQADIGRRRDAWIPRLAILAGAAGLIAIVSFAYFSISLRSGTSTLRTETARLPR
jgi:type VI secretion system protein ImpK